LAVVLGRRRLAEGVHRGPHALLLGRPASAGAERHGGRQERNEKAPHSRSIEWGRMSAAAPIKSWLRCYRCWSQDLEVQVHYEGIHRIDPVTGKRADVVDELQEAVVQCLDCMHDQPHLIFHNDRIEPVEDRWERMVVGTPWVASCTVTVDGDSVETCSGPEAADSLAYAAFGDH